MMTLPLLQKLLQLRDELALQTHLMSMDLKYDFQQLQQRIRRLEAELETSLVDLAKRLGKAEEDFFVGDKNEMEQLVKEFRDIQKKLDDQQDEP